MPISDRAVVQAARQFARNPWGALQTLAACAEVGHARNAKEEILSSNSENEYLQEIVYAAYSDEVYFVRLNDVEIEEIADKKKNLPPKDGSGRAAFQRFKELLERLSEKTVSGNAARDELYEFLEDKSLNYLETLFYARAINHDLRVNFSIHTVKKIWPKMFQIRRKSGTPQYMGCMLCAKIEGDTVLEYPVWAEPKADGYRLSIVSDKKGALDFTRNGNSYPAMEHLNALLADYPGFMYDAEAMAINWNDTSSLLTTKKPEKLEALWPRIDAELNLWMFDMVTLEDYYSEDFTAPFKKRRKALRKFVKSLNHPRIKLMPGKVINNEEELLAFYKKMLKKGFEGIVVKTRDGLYEICTSSTRPMIWMKLKPEDDETMVITGYIEGNGKLRGSLGKFKCVSLDGKKKYKVGGSFKGSLTHEKRKELWKIRKSLIGKKIDVVNQKEDEGLNKIVARFPRFKRFRDDL